MRKMEAAGEILARTNPQGKSWSGQTPNSSETLRRDAVEEAIRRIYTSARKPPPMKDSATLRLETEDALKLWKDIPTQSLPEAVDAAIIEAGAFQATNGLVAKLWAARKAKLPELDHAALGRRQQEEERRYLAAPDNRPPTPEEREANAQAAAAIARMLAGGT